MQWVRNIWYIIFGRIWLCVYVRLREAIASLSLIAISRNVRHNDVRFTTSCRWNRIKLKYGASYRSTSDTTCCHLLFSNQLLTTYNFHIHATPSPGWGPRGQGPSNNRQGPDKNNWTVHVRKIEKDQMATLCSMEAGADGWVTLTLITPVPRLTTYRLH